jgi:hypothetical protein
MCGFRLHNFVMRQISKCRHAAVFNVPPLQMQHVEIWMTAAHELPPDLDGVLTSTWIYPPEKHLSGADSLISWSMPIGAGTCVSPSVQMAIRCAKRALSFWMTPIISVY